MIEGAADLSADWLGLHFDLGRIRAIVHAGSGQKNPLGVLRLETSAGSFAVKRFDEGPRPAALAIEDAAWRAGFPMPQPHRTTGGAPYASYDDAGRPVWVRVYSWIPGVAKFALVWATPPGAPPRRDAVQAFIAGYRDGGRFVSRGVLDLTHRARSLLAWVAFNVRRDLSEHPGTDPELTPALLAAVPPLDRDTLEREATLLH